MNSTGILTTKLYIPPSRPNAISRPLLVAKLQSSMNRLASFSLLSGPAGSGKTTLLSESVGSYPCPVAWLSLDNGDNDPNRFWMYVIAACQAVLEDVGNSAAELLQMPQPLKSETIPILFINDLAADDRSLVLVLDDYHVIDHPIIHSGMQFLLDHLPYNLHIVIGSRTDPPWPLARYRARNQLVEIRAQELRFQLDEVTDFLNRTMGLQLSAEEVAALEERTEGWIAGLHLAALSPWRC